MLTTTLVLAASLFTMPPQKSDAVVGVTAIHIESGKRISVRGSERFPMGSVYKFPIALAVLRRVDTGTMRLRDEITIEPKDFSPGHSPLRDEAHGQPVTMTLRELLRYNTSLSDNTACDVLIGLLGGPQAVSTRMAELGIGGIHINRTEKQIAKDLRAPDGVARYARDARDTSTPDDMASLLVAFFQGRDGLSRESHELLMHWMTVTPTGARRIKSSLVEGAELAHKTGTMPGTVNDVGVITSPDGEHHIAIAIFTKSGTSERDAEDDIALVARAAYEYLMRATAE